jgi:hypothetical protein
MSRFIIGGVKQPGKPHRLWMLSDTDLVLQPAVDGAGGVVLVPAFGLQVDRAHARVYCNVKIGSMAV